MFFKFLPLIILFGTFYLAHAKSGRKLASRFPSMDDKRRNKGKHARSGEEDGLPDYINDPAYSYMKGNIWHIEERD
ncbi:hypothetical protein [Geotalea sp. SG265]|uniref:hypothetical protein n=1 Tax=Geotalea sp. SG265 TaxID=2922867 RepID=UPI001FAE9734|nr:hypothetical protein [Geotalea sp. SG265]